MLQYITNTDVSLPVVEQVKAVLEGGCRWVQVRMKDATDEEIAAVVEEIKPFCLEKDAFLILNDRVELAKKLDVGGVHLGKEDMPASQARMKLGPAAVIGCTANTFDDITAVSSLDIDYFGVGPYHDTTTKKRLAPVLAVDGIRDIVTQMRQAEINIPVVAVGGIRLEDVRPLMQAGVNGLAVSGAIACAEDPVGATRAFLSALAEGTPS